MKFKISIFILLFSITIIFCSEIDNKVDYIEFIEYDEYGREVNRTYIPVSQSSIYKKIAKNNNPIKCSTP